MSVELECKVRVDDHDSVRQALKAAGATYVGRVLETNRLFDRNDGSLSSSGRGLRVRSTVPLDGEAPGTTLTYKGPRQSSTFKQREEIEVHVDDATSMADILRALGFVERFRFQKRRESWRMESCLVELDELPVLGRFIEVEGPDEATIRTVLHQLGVERAQPIQESYVSMLSARTDAAAAGIVEFNDQ